MVVVSCCGSLWFVVARCCSMWFVVVCCGSLWFVVARCGSLWLWLVVVRYGYLWFFLACCGSLWLVAYTTVTVLCEKSQMASFASSIMKNIFRLSARFRSPVKLICKFFLDQHSKRAHHVEFTSIRNRYCVDTSKSKFRQISRHFHVLFRCNFAGRKIHVVSTYFFRCNFDDRKIYLFPRTFFSVISLV